MNMLICVNVQKWLEQKKRLYMNTRRGRQEEVWGGRWLVGGGGPFDFDLNNYWFIYCFGRDGTGLDAAGFADINQNAR